MIKVEKLGVILSPTDREFEKYGVLNAGIYQDGNTIHILYRAVHYGNISTIGYAKSEGPFNIVERHDKPLVDIDYEYEKHGVEDPRITFIDGVYLIFINI
jgi:predicted GH43/DUF377 family glycosyl hydrolase